MKIKIGYNKLLVSVPVVLALALALLSYFSAKEGKEVSQTTYFLIFGMLLLSVPMYFLPYIVVTDSEIWVNNQFGAPRKKAKINGLKDVRFDGADILVTSDNYERPLPYNKMLVDTRALIRFKNKLRQESGNES